MTLESSKNLGGIGAILLFIGVIPFVQFLWVIGLVGAILILVALHGLANYYSERGIFNNAIYGLIAGIVGGIIAVAVAIFTVLTSLTDFLHAIYPNWNGDWSTLQGLTPNTANITPSDILPFIAGILLVIAVMWIFAIIAAFFTRRSLKLLSTKSSVGLFSTAGLLLLVGAALIIIFGIGVILMWISALILAIAFFTMKPTEPPAPTAATQAPPAPTPV